MGSQLRALTKPLKRHANMVLSVLRGLSSGPKKLQVRMSKFDWTRAEIFLHFSLRKSFNMTLNNFILFIEKNFMLEKKLIV